MEVCSFTGDSVAVCQCGRPKCRAAKQKVAEMKQDECDCVSCEPVEVGMVVGNISFDGCNCHIKQALLPEEKMRYDLLPIEALEELVLAYTIGARKYKHAPAVDPTSNDDEFAAIMRHLVAYRKGDSRDKEGHHHLAAVMARCAKLIARESHAETFKSVTTRNSPSKVKK